MLGKGGLYCDIEWVGGIVTVYFIKVKLTWKGCAMAFDRDKFFTELLGQDGGFEELINNRPLLAHYTSITVAAKILKEEKIWLSNPLFMNDLQELRTGIRTGATLFFRNDAMILDACGGDEHKQKLLQEAFSSYLTQFEERDALDVYIFCLSEIEKDDTDGQLPMWRSYADEGNGAAIVFNTGSIVETEKPAPLLIAKVNYVTDAAREVLIEEAFKRLCDNIKLNAPSDVELPDCAYLFFQAIKILALFHKHTGFSDEREWRAIYFKENDPTESQAHKLEFSYYIDPHGIQPKLIFHLIPDEDETWAFKDIIERIILGPSVSTALAKGSFLRMLEVIKQDSLKTKVVTSTIPLRPKVYIS